MIKKYYDYGGMVDAETMERSNVTGPFVTFGDHEAEVEAEISALKYDMEQLMKANTELCADVKEARELALKEAKKICEELEEQRLPHSDWPGPDDCASKIGELMVGGK